MFELLILTAICLWFIFWCIIGRICASHRGINPTAGFLAGLFLGPLSLLILFCKPMKW